MLKFGALALLLIATNGCEMVWTVTTRIVLGRL
jgi:hypothetical protein